MKHLFKEITLPGLIIKHKVFVWYFVVSFCLLGSIVEAPFWFLIALLLNFANAARLVKQVPIPENDPEDPEI